MIARARTTGRSAGHMVVAIDGPAGAGKTTVARALARALDVPYVETGSMYRAITWLALRDRLDPGDGAALASVARRAKLGYGPGGFEVDGVPLGRRLRSARVNRAVSEVSSHPSVRRVLVARQRALVRGRSAVVEGRDIGTVVCPDATVKVFLTASPEARARRRHREIVRGGSTMSLRALKRDIERRDAIDSGRRASPLRPARDAVVIDSTGRPPREIVNEILALVRAAGGGV